MLQGTGALKIQQRRIGSNVLFVTGTRVNNQQTCHENESSTDKRNWTIYKKPTEKTNK